METQWAICCNGLSMRQGGLIGALLLRWEARIELSKHG